uniref:Vesicle-associated membrane protein 7 n=1 Tax=Vombatus ursinus TaxID=29139 RepID=A0A4X2KXH9_VOMUR
MTITYSCIANGQVILAELALTGGSYQDAVSSVLKLVLLKPEKKTTARIGSYVYHTLLADGITYLCATDNLMDVTLPSAFLDEMKYNQNQGEFMISDLKSQVTDVRNSMSQNVGKMLKREEKLNILIDRTDNLQVATKAFQKTTTKASKKMWWKNYKIIIIISSIFIIIIIILLSTNVISV